METAFGHAMIDAVNGKVKDYGISFDSLFLEGSSEIFLATRDDENKLLDSISFSEDGTILDCGCGVGRHLARMRMKYPKSKCCGMEHCDLMRSYCQAIFDEPKSFFRSWDDIPEIKYDLILLMGNGFGIMGSEDEARSRLAYLTSLLSSGGTIMIESGNPFSTGYKSTSCTVFYENMLDGPFTWGFADKDWVERQLTLSRCKVDFLPSEGPGFEYFFAVGRF